MEYNLPSELVKNLDFGDNAKNKVITGVNKLSQAVKSTLGASGKCVIYEDGRGKPVITKDGVTVAESVVLFDPVENMGATLIKEAARLGVLENVDFGSDNSYELEEKDAEIAKLKDEISKIKEETNKKEEPYKGMSEDAIIKLKAMEYNLKITSTITDFDNLTKE